MTGRQLWLAHHVHPHLYSVERAFLFPSWDGKNHQCHLRYLSPEKSAPMGGEAAGPKWRRHCVSFWKERIPVDISNSPTPGQRCFSKFNLCYFVTAFWLCNLHSVEFNHFIKVYNSVNFSVFTELCVRLAINLRTFFITPRRNWYLLTIIPISVSPSLWSP